MPAAIEEAAADLEEGKPARANRDLSTIASEPVLTSTVTNKNEGPEEDQSKPKKGGWWQRRGFF
ncbi:hypothetical protein D3C87_1953200 [compost metagenome]